MHEAAQLSGKLAAGLVLAGWVLAPLVARLRSAPPPAGSYVAARDSSSPQEATTYLAYIHNQARAWGLVHLAFTTGVSATKNAREPLSKEWVRLWNWSQRAGRCGRRRPSRVEGGCAELA